MSILSELTLEFHSALNTFKKVCKGVDELLDDEGDISAEQREKMRFQIIRRPWRIVAKVIHKMQSQGYYWDSEAEEIVKSKYFAAMDNISPVVEDEYAEYDFEYDGEEDEDGESIEAEDDGEGVEQELAIDVES